MSLLRFPVRRPVSYLLRRDTKSSTIGLRKSSNSHLPRIAQADIWHSIIPKFLRRSPQAAPNASSTQSQGSRKWMSHPSTPVVLLGLLAGSQAIQILDLKSSSEEKQRMMTQKLAKLAEVIKRVQAGDEVDIKKELGTGIPEAEKEWEDVLKQIPDDSMWLKRRSKQMEEKQENSVQFSRWWNWTRHEESLPKVEAAEPQQPIERSRPVAFY